MGKNSPSVIFFDNLINKFKEVFLKSIKVEIDYINEVLDRIRLSKGYVPILTVITDYQPLSKERINALIDFLGMPYTFTNNGDFMPPRLSTPNSDEIFNDMFALIGHNTLFTYLTDPDSCGYTCPLHSLCEKQEIDKAECYDEPWNGNECPMTIMGSVINLKEKQIEIQY